MDSSRIPLPTDNIFKFYALFGLILAVTAIAATLYVHSTTNTLIFDAAIEYEELSSKEQPTAGELKRKEMVEKRAKIAAEDKRFYSDAAGILFGVGICLSFFGFWKWHRIVQPKLDTLLDLQIEKAKQELKQSRTPFRRT